MREIGKKIQARKIRKTDTLRDRKCANEEKKKEKSKDINPRKKKRKN